MSATITLAKPIQAHGETLTALVFRDPCARDLREFKIGDATVGNFIPADRRARRHPAVGGREHAPGRYVRGGGGDRPFVAAAPANWGDILAELAWGYGWPPAVLWRLSIREMLFWHDKLRVILGG